MTIQALGIMGELISAVATVATLVYLAIRLKQNTCVLRSQTFQQNSMDMSLKSNLLLRWRTCQNSCKGL